MIFIVTPTAKPIGPYAPSDPSQHLTTMFCSLLRLTLSILTLALAVPLAAQQTRHSFTYTGDDFFLDGKPFQIIAGELHYARIPKEYWRHRLQMAKAMGLNTVATYVFWNYHEQRPGVFDFKTENRNLAEFIRLAQQEGLWVIVRPGPYVCAEWEFGGYPWWLLKEKGLIVRSMDKRFLDACRRYIVRLAKEIASLQVTRGGPILLMQVENEYGSFASDKNFLAATRDIIRNAGFSVPLFTADGPSQCRSGCIDGVLPAINGEENHSSLKDTVRKYHGGAGPFFSPEFYPGWLDNWGLKKSIVPVEDIVGKYDTLLRNGISTSLYMFHGGTNFGFMNGANSSHEYPILPQPTSYDYDAPLDEAGRPTKKYFTLRSVNAKYLPTGSAMPSPPETNPIISIDTIQLSESAPISALLAKPIVASAPLSMEDLNQGYGYVLYRTKLPRSMHGTLRISGLREYAVVLIDGEKRAVLDRRMGIDSAEIGVTPANATLDLLVENLGRINYGNQLTENRKGIVGDVTFGGDTLHGWEMYPVRFDSFARVQFDTAQRSAPLLRRGTFMLDRTGDTFLDMRDWGKGCVWINGHNLGRYWRIGPQQTLYVPGVWLRKGKNEIVVFEQLSDRTTTTRGLVEPILASLRTNAVTFSTAFNDDARALIVELSTDDPTAAIRYTRDGTTPTSQSPRYFRPIVITEATTLAAQCFGDFISSRPTLLHCVPSLSTGARISLMEKFSARYSAGGDNALVDGIRGSANFRDGRWQGYHGNDVETVIDLGEAKAINRISIDFMHAIDSWVFQPAWVEFAQSIDGTTFTTIERIAGDPNHRAEGPVTKRFSATTSHLGRFIKVTAKNIGVCPDWHKGAGKKAWLFADEIVVE